MATDTRVKKLLTAQVRDLQERYPQAQVVWGRGQLVWTGTIQPSPISEQYSVSIAWNGRTARPTVRVVAPKLKDRAGEVIPHVFRDGSLCLHYRGEWNTRMNIAETIIPWTSEWLYYYELWHATGDWLGGGHLAAAKPDSATAA
jgi:hypothetical protein